MFVTLASVLPAATPAPAQPPIRAAALAPLDSGFLWGVASSGFQSEGRTPDSNWSRYIARNPGYEPLQNSVDFADRYESDIRLAADMGMRVFRIGIEWARLQPAPGVWDENAFHFYDSVIGSIERAGMRPMITLDHWVYPGITGSTRAGRRIGAAGAIPEWSATGWRICVPWSIGTPRGIRCG